MANANKNLLKHLRLAIQLFNKQKYSTDEAFELVDQLWGFLLELTIPGSQQNAGTIDRCGAKGDSEDHIAEYPIHIKWPSALC